MRQPDHFRQCAFLRLSGFKREEVLGQDFNFMLDKAAEPETLASIRAEFKTDSKGGSEVCFGRKDGTQFWAGIFVSPVHDEAGDVVQYFACFVDLTRRKNQSRTLIEELNHRVKNTLATVQAIVWQAFRTGGTPEAIQDAVESRLFALSRSHDLLTRQNWQSVALAESVIEAVAPFTGKDGLDERIAICGDEIQLQPRVALALSTAFNELATNAVKYGALSTAPDE